MVELIKHAQTQSSGKKIPNPVTFIIWWPTGHLPSIHSHTKATPDARILFLHAFQTADRLVILPRWIQESFLSIETLLSKHAKITVTTPLLT